MRLFEAACCGVPIISDRWLGIEDVLAPDREIILADDGEAVVRALESSDAAAATIGAAARARVLAAHTAAHRAEELENHLQEAAGAALRAAS